MFLVFFVIPYSPVKISIIFWRIKFILDISKTIYNLKIINTIKLKLISTLIHQQKFKIIKYKFYKVVFNYYKSKEI